MKPAEMRDVEEGVEKGVRMEESKVLGEAGASEQDDSEGRCDASAKPR